MSYTRTFHKTVTVHYSRTVNYPASENGGSITVSGSESEDVAVNIHVDTDAFDSQVARCNQDINQLTGAVTTAQSAQIASLSFNAHRIGKAIVDGFFKTVRSEITQQITALTSEVDATAKHLCELAKRCVDKRRQMQADYDRITSRYTKTFIDLNRELENRIYMLDKYAFDLRRHSEKYTLPLISSELVGHASVISHEEANTTAIMQGARSKSLAADTIGAISNFLEDDAATNALLQDCTVPSTGRPVKYAPVIHVQRINSDRSIKRETFVPDDMMKSEREAADKVLQQYPWKPVSDADLTSLGQLFEEKLSDGTKGSSPHETRVREMARRLYAADASRAFHRKD